MNIMLQTVKRNYILIILSFTLAGTGVSCGSGVNLFAKSDDVQLGQQMQQQIASDPAHYPILNNPTLTAYVQSIENRIVQSPNVKNKDFQYTVKIINDPNTVNAFSIPGGAMYVYTGLLNFIDDESALAGVLAHETTHADHRHATQTLTKQYGLQVITALALGNNPSLLAQIAASLGTQLSVLKFTRDEERDADQGSFDDLNQLPGQPWWPGGVNLFLQKSLSQSKSQPGKFEQLFLTHPVDQERINNTNANIQKAGIASSPSSAQLNTANYQRYKSMVGGTATSPTGR